MNFFFLDIASHNGALACVNDASVLSCKEVNTRIRDHELIPLVGTCLQEAGWVYEDLDRVVCIVGPGGFTSLRVAVSFANTLGDQLEIEEVGVHLVDLFLARDKSPKSKVQSPKLVWLHATKKDSLFIRGFGEHEKTWPKPMLISITDAIKQIPEETVWMGELLDTQREAFDALHLKEAELQPLTAVLPGFLKGLKGEKKSLVPWYGREG